MKFKKSILLFIVPCFLLTISLTSCGGNPPHEHTFDEKWTTNESSHWHKATCEHTDLSKDMGDHTDSNKDGKCDVCEYNLPVDIFTFVFNSDYCSLDNNDSYTKGIDVNLTLSINDEQKEYYVVPNDVNVLFGKSLGVKGVDYTYLVNKQTNTATLSLKVTNNVVVTALYKDSENIYKVGPNQLTEAKDFSNASYVQSHYVNSKISSSISVINEFFIDLSPTVNYQYGCTAISGAHDYINYEMLFYENCGDYLNKYKFDINDFSWNKTREDDTSYFMRGNDLASRVLYRLDLITYDLIKDGYDENSKSYKFALSDGTKNYEVSLSFNENKIVSATYTCMQSNNIETKETYLNYKEYTPELPIANS